MEGDIMFYNFTRTKEDTQLELLSRDPIPKTIKFEGKEFETDII